MLDSIDFDLVPVPGPNLDSTIDVLKTYPAVCADWIALMKLFSKLVAPLGKRAAGPE
jgi:hypothetical protein